MALARIYEDPALTSCYDKNLHVRSGIEQCPTTDFPKMLARVPRNKLGKLNNSLFYKLQYSQVRLEEIWSVWEEGTRR